MYVYIWMFLKESKFIYEFANNVDSDEVALEETFSETL